MTTRLPKRPRSNSEIPKDGSALSNAYLLKPHKTLWFEDASIVLATDVHLYRVHKSMLAKYSSVFKGMLDMPTGGEEGESEGSAGGERYEGLPFVKIVGDSDEDVYHFLMALYDRDFYHIYKPTKFAILSSLLIMSTKYDIPSIRSAVIKHLERYYPKDVTKLDLDLDEGLYDEGPASTHDFQLFAVAHRCNVQLPMLYYECALWKPDHILGRLNEIGEENVSKIVLGREKLLRMSGDFGVQVLFPHEQCQSSVCIRSRTLLLVQWIGDSELHGNFPVDAISEGLEGICGDNLNLRDRICTACSAKATAAIQRFKTEFWAKLPMIFGLGTWDEVKGRG